MPKAYLAVFYREAPGEENLAAYAGPAKEAIEAMGGTFIARGMPVATFELGQMQRSVIIQFDSAEAAVAAYESEAYQAALAHIGVERDMRVIEGV
jgi:uncharacterized protein (DUF1330 family)